ncbi:MAG TPA: hypothetical protein VFX98_06440 [Longimicrobiaceae bacterium]|nr:hypothetical protein [Longimicrobiaceae bacterium]
MSAVEFDRLPDDARLWVFAASRALEPAEGEALLERVDHFLERWLAHGAEVVGGRELRHGRFLLVGADERATGVSGCSIDTLFHALAALEEELGVTLRDSGPVQFRDEEGAIRSVPRSEFRLMARTGEVTEETVVFDNTVATVGEARAGRWETRLRDTWHARAFPVAATA